MALKRVSKHLLYLLNENNLFFFQRKRLRAKQEHSISKSYSQIGHALYFFITRPPSPPALHQLPWASLYPSSKQSQGAHFKVTTVSAHR